MAVVCSGGWVGMRKGSVGFAGVSLECAEGAVFGMVIPPVGGPFDTGGGTVSVHITINQDCAISHDFIHSFLTHFL